MGLRPANHHQRVRHAARAFRAFQYEAERSRGGLTSVAGLPLYRELVYSGCLAAAIRGHVQVAGRQGQLDTQMGLVDPVRWRLR